MNVISACALPVGSVLRQTGAGQWTLTVVARATFVLAPGESSLAPDQGALQEGDSYWNDDERCSLRAADDLVPFKRHADVLLVGHAYAPQRQPVASLAVRLKVGEVDKSVEVFGDRAFALDGSIREGARFVSTPLYWERAAGGPETSNPVGRRMDVADTRGVTLLPNLQPPGVHVTSRLDFIPPVCFAPIAPWWPPRQGKIHRGLGGWDFRRWRMGLLPADLDPGFFNAAPADQQIDALRANERIVLEHLHPEHARLATSLVAVKPRALLERPGTAPEEFAMRCDTLTIDTDRGTCALTWRGQIPLDHATAGSRVVVTTDEKPRVSAPTLTGVRELSPGLPFVAPAGPSVPPPPPAPGRRDTVQTLVPGRGFPRAAALPFAPSAIEDPETLPPSPAPQPSGLRVGDLDSETVDVPGTSPLARALEAGPPPPRAPVFGVPPVADLAPPATWSASAPEAPPLPAPAPPPTPASLPPPPAMIGPLAKAPLVEPSEPPPVDEPTGEVSAPAPAPAPPPGPQPLPLDEYPLERCAAIAASLAHAPTEKARILREQKLKPDRWTALDRHYTEQIRAQAGRGRTAPLRAYDAAYVAQLEKERGPIRVEDLARLVVAEERGAVDDELTAQRLPRGALLRIRRVWLTRESADPEIGKNVRAAVEAAREEDPP